MTGNQSIESPNNERPPTPEVSDIADEPMKVLRVGTMARQLLEEVRGATLDEESRRRLGDVQRGTITELKGALSAELGEELDRMWQPFADDRSRSQSELRVAQAELVGWLEGVFHGIQTALAAQQMGARGQLAGLQQQALDQPGDQPEQPPGGQYL